jgi:hypothetical protein
VAALRDGYALAQAGRELVHLGIGELLHVEQLDDLVHARGKARALESVQLSEKA